MAVPSALLEQLMRLDDRERVEVAQMLLSTVEDDEDEDDLDEAETARLHAALERSLDDIKAGRVHDAAYRVQLTSEARRQLVEIGEWWMENRRKAPDLVLRELARATSLLSVTPRAGKAYRRSTSASYRRLLLRRSRFHVYYVIDEAIWNAVRGHGPELP
jgi:hypothetical protein